MDPGTAAILVLSTITGISGYGAWKLNARRGASIDEEVKKAIGDAQAIIAATQKAKEIAEQERNKKDKEVQKLKKDLADLRVVEDTLKSEKETLSNKLESATELEKTYRELSPEVFKQAINDFKSKPEIEKLGHPELFEPLLSRFSVTRGTAQSLYTKLSNTVVTMIPKPEFDTLLLDTLKNADRSLEQKRLEEAETARLAKEETDKAAADAKTKKLNDAAAAKIAKAETARLAKIAKDQATEAAKTVKLNAAKEATAAKAVKDAKTLQEIVNEAFETAKKGPLTSNTVYQSIKTPFLSGVDSVARGVQKTTEAAKQVAKKTSELLSTPARLAAERKQRLEAARQLGGADTFDTDIYYRLFHPKDEDRPYRTLADLFEKTSTDTSLARNMMPVFDAFMYWRKTVLNFPLLYKPELVAAAETLFKLVEPIRVNAVFQDKELKKAIEAVGKVGTRINPMTGRTADASDVRAVKESKVEPVKEFKEIIDEPPKRLTLRTPKGGMRKKKLRTRRGVKQNVRRTRRSQNRPNRTDTYSSRRSEVDASGDELGL